MFQKLRPSGTLSERAYKTLKESILYLDLKPGAVLIEEELSEMLGISRTPIREALRRLSYEGLIRFTSGRRMHVTELSIDYFLNVAAIREPLELLAVRLASLHRTDSDIERMKNHVAEQFQHISQDMLNSRKFLDVDRQYHISLVESSKNPLLLKYIQEVNEAFHRYLHYTEFAERAVNVVNEHERVVQAIIARDSNEAERIMRSHLADVKESILIALSKK